MRLPEREYESNSTSPDFHPRASSSSLSPSLKANGHVANGCGSPVNGSSKRSRGLVAKVELPGTTIYDDSYIDREEYIRLVIQSLRDIGYMCVFEPVPFIRLRSRSATLANRLPHLRLNRAMSWRHRAWQSSADAS